MRDQADGLRKMLKDKDASSRIIAVTSGKGGVGKTNVAVNVSLALVQMGYRVALIDVDLGLANADIVLGVNPLFNLGHVFRGERSLEEIIVEGPLGLKLVAGGSGVLELANLNGWRLELFANSLERLNQDFDFIFLDTGAGLHRNVMSFVLAVNEVLVVTTPEPTALTDAYGLIKVVFQQNPEIRTRLIVNMAESPNEAETTAGKLNSVLGEFVKCQVEYIGYILSEQQINKAVADQRPVLLAFPSSMSSRSMKRIAAVLAGGKSDSPGLGMEGFFARVYEFLRT